MNLRPVAVALLFASLPGLAVAADAPTAKFRLEQSTIAPGATLPPGDYSIQVIDHLQDRVLLRVEGKEGASNAVFIAVPSKELTGHSGPVNWTTKTEGTTALRGFVFNNGAFEFVYPKDQAVSLAKSNGIGVLAVDPASEGKPSELAKLSKDDMQIVTLWMLTPKRVEAAAGEVSISAAKYQSSAVNEGSAAPGNQQASVSSHPAILKRLPHTASSLPLVFLTGISATLLAFYLRRRRQFGATA